MTNHTTEHKPILTGSWTDLLGVTVKCPYGGVLKNFVLRKNSSELWYEYQCYSSKSLYIDFGEPIIKDGAISEGIKHKSREIDEDIEYLSNLSLYCSLDYGLNSFEIYNKEGVLITYIICIPLKPKYSTKIEIKTEEKSAHYTKMDGLVDIVVGRTEIEDDENRAYPLRGFKYKYDETLNEDEPTMSYYYGYSVLRYMLKEYYSARRTFESLRNNNTQKD